MVMTRDEAKQERSYYIQIARRIYGTSNIKIHERANVMRVDDGAFVEATVFVPKEALMGTDTEKQ